MNCKLIVLRAVNFPTVLYIENIFCCVKLWSFPWNRPNETKICDFRQPMWNLVQKPKLCFQTFRSSASLFYISYSTRCIFWFSLYLWDVHHSWRELVRICCQFRKGKKWLSIVTFVSSLGQIAVIQRKQFMKLYFTKTLNSFTRQTSKNDYFGNWDIALEELQFCMHLYNEIELFKTLICVY